ncbi:hypothetical protein [Micromonospora sp. DT47]|uniref:hypothetical protein n=1 Tax=Micromonospora sp. DT47 TaxID=3393431 RepID=UPI003CF0D058
MQIIEVTGMGVRSAVIRLERRETPLRFILFPMIHLGRPEFYDAVRDRVSCCALVVAEGRDHTRPRVSLPGLAYRLLRRQRRSRLVVQRLREETLGVPVVRPDLSLDEIRHRLRRLPTVTYLLARLTIRVVVPWVALYVLLFGAQRFLAGELALDDDTPYIEPSLGKRWDDIDGVIVDDRDALLLDALAKIHEARCGESIDVAVVYGARHMPAVLHGLRKRYGYRARGADWLTVFDLDD